MDKFGRTAVNTGGAEEPGPSILHGRRERRTQRIENLDCGPTSVPDGSKELEHRDNLPPQVGQRQRLDVILAQSQPIQAKVLLDGEHAADVSPSVAAGRHGRQTAEL
jgi:ABC-type uncharacterized transport system ATPase component